MRVLMTADALGGVWQYASDLAGELARSGIEVVLAVMGPTRAPAHVPGVRVVETGLDLDWTAPDAQAVAGSTAALVRMAAELRATVVHLHAPALVGTAVWPAPVVAVAHSCVATWWAAVRGGPLPHDLAWRAELTASGLRTADLAVAPTHALAANLRSAYGPIDLAVVPNGRRTEPLPRRPERRVLTVGRLWDEGKNVAMLDRAAARLDVPVFAAGPVEGPGTSVKLDHVQLLGTLGPHALVRERACAGVFASVPRYEPFGLAVLEAAQAGVPLVLSDIPTLRELWDGAARFVRDEDSLVSALQATLADPGDLGERARERAGHYTLEKMACLTLSVWGRVGVRGAARAATSCQASGA